MLDAEAHIAHLASPRRTQLWPEDSHRAHRRARPAPFWWAASQAHELCPNMTRSDRSWVLLGASSRSEQQRQTY
eukprot:3380703-Pleurochrysis_carterae.AAC.1